MRMPKTTPISKPILISEPIPIPKSMLIPEQLPEAILEPISKPILELIPDLLSGIDSDENLFFPITNCHRISSRFVQDFQN